MVNKLGKYPLKTYLKIHLIGLTFTSVLYNTLDRPCPNSLSTPGRFLPYTGWQAHDSSNASTTQDTFFVIIFYHLNHF